VRTASERERARSKQWRRPLKAGSCRSGRQGLEGYCVWIQRARVPSLTMTAVPAICTATKLALIDFKDATRTWPGRFIWVALPAHENG